VNFFNAICRLLRYEGRSSAGIYTHRQAENACAAILELRTVFQKRLSALRSIGHELSIELAEFDLAAIGVVLRSLETVLEGFEKW
jgi:hypothetical protein